MARKEPTMRKIFSVLLTVLLLEMGLPASASSLIGSGGMSTSLTLALIATGVALVVVGVGAGVLIKFANNRSDEKEEELSNDEDYGFPQK